MIHSDVSPTPKGVDRSYPSRVDAWLAAALAAAPLLIVGLGVFALERSVTAGVIQIAFGVLVAGLIAALSIPCVYTLTDDMLLIRSGFLREAVPLLSIRGAEMSASWWSAPALSIKRVKVTLDDGYRLISPKERETFIADLNARRSALERRDKA